jgi:hypothetical protein
MASRKPFSCQKSLTGSHSWSAGPFDDQPALVAGTFDAHITDSVLMAPVGLRGLTQLVRRCRDGPPGMV